MRSLGPIIRTLSDYFVSLNYVIACEMVLTEPKLSLASRYNRIPHISFSPQILNCL